VVRRFDAEEGWGAIAAPDVPVTALFTFSNI
jgi:hypothetical protein